jgi:hypothetical protein
VKGSKEARPPSPSSPSASSALFPVPTLRLRRRDQPTSPFRRLFSATKDTSCFAEERVTALLEGRRPEAVRGEVVLKGGRGEDLGLL